MYFFCLSTQFGFFGSSCATVGSSWSRVEVITWRDWRPHQRDVFLGPNGRSAALPISCYAPCRATSDVQQVHYCPPRTVSVPKDRPSRCIQPRGGASIRADPLRSVMCIVYGDFWQCGLVHCQSVISIPHQTSTGAFSLHFIAATWILRFFFWSFLIPRRRGSYNGVLCSVSI